MWAVLLSVLAAVAVDACRCGAEPELGVRAPAEAAAPRPGPDGAAPSRPRPAPAGLSAVLRELPEGVDWVVAVRAPARWVARLANLSGWLGDVPILRPWLRRIHAALAGFFGRWPPADRAWRSVGLDPAGGIAVAGLSRPTPGGASWVAVLAASDPDRLLRRLAGRPRRVHRAARSRRAHRVARPVGPPRGGAASARARHATFWWPILGEVSCAVRSAAVVCAGGKRGPPPASGASRARVPAGWSLATADLYLRAAGASGRLRLAVALRFAAGGLTLRARLWGARVRPLARWLAPPGPLSPPPPQRLAALFFRLDPSALAPVLRWLPRAVTHWRTSDGRVIDLGSVLSGAGDRWWLILGPAGWRLAGRRSGGPASAPGQGPQSLQNGGGTRVWLCRPPGRLVLAATRAACGSAARSRPAGLRRAGPRRAGPRRGGPPGPLRPAARGSLALWWLITDPFELLPARVRARLVAAQWGLAPPERAAVIAGRALLTLLGELWLTASPDGDALRVRARLRSPLAESPAARRRFRRAFRAKWEGGGFFALPDLARLSRSDAGGAGARLARLLRAGWSQAPWADWLGGWLMRGLARLRSPEVSCARLATRLAQCQAAWGRGIEPERWAESDQPTLPHLRQRLRRDLRERARLRAAALRGRCDARQGRLDNALALRACLPLAPCRAFVTCVLESFRHPGARRARPEAGPARWR